MSIRTFETKTPQIDASAFVDETAVIIGEVDIGKDSSIWPMTVLRGDINSIHIGKRTNIQDGTVIHVTHAGELNEKGSHTRVGNDVTVGHRVILHGCTISDLCLIGMGSIVMDNVIIEPEVILGAGSLVPPEKILLGGYLWLGSPAQKIRPLSEHEKKNLRYSAQYYVDLQKRYHRAL